MTNRWNMQPLRSNILLSAVNPLTPNNLQRCRAVSPINRWMTYKDITNSVLKFWGILFTPIWLAAVACYDAGPLKVRPSFRSQSVPPPPPKPHHKHRYTHRHLGNVHFSKLTNTVLTLPALTITCYGVQCGLKYQHWPMKWTLVVDQKGCQWHTVPI